MSGFLFAYRAILCIMSTVTFLMPHVDKPNYMTPRTYTKKIRYALLAVAFALVIYFIRLQVIARNEPASADSGANLLVTAVMIAIPCILIFVAVRREKRK